MTVEIPRFLTSTQADLVRETEPARMDKLDEDALLELHTRVRRARSKYVKLYRQTGRPGRSGGGQTSPTPQADVSRHWQGQCPRRRRRPPAAGLTERSPRAHARGGRCKHAPAGHEDHGRPQTRRVVTGQRGCAAGEEGLALTA